MAKILITIGILFYAGVVPFFEINASHVFNPEWPSHARLHEVWQLATNTTMGIVSLYLVWFRGEFRVPALLLYFVTGGLVFAYLTRTMYGGSMVLSDGSEKTLLGINLGMLAFGLAILLATIALDLDRRARNPK